LPAAIQTAHPYRFMPQSGLRKCAADFESLEEVAKQLIFMTNVYMPPGYL
jgi:hypothetical protein